MKIPSLVWTYSQGKRRLKSNLCLFIHLQNAPNCFNNLKKLMFLKYYRPTEITEIYFSKNTLDTAIDTWKKFYFFQNRWKFPPVLKQTKAQWKDIRKTYLLVL